MAEEIIQSRAFPDEIVYCGIRPVFMPYTDPGVTLALAMKKAVTEFIEAENTTPKVILIRNHGFIALGGNAHEVEAITGMWVKTARVLFGAYQLGGIHYMSKDNINRIYTRPDEEYRLRQFKG
jgi:rhamnose utilization protein RhaD (predicted bifunctional aldolase and dehydrogenase)